MSRYGVNIDTTLNNIREISPTLKYIGNTNYTLLYGNDVSGVVANINKMFSTSNFQDRIKKAATIGQKLTGATALSKMLSHIDSFLAHTRRMAISQMLYGAYIPATRFSGYNRWTTFSIFFSTVGSPYTKLSTAIKFVGTSGLLGSLSFVDKIFQKSDFKLFDSSRYLYAPPDVVIIRARAGGATRDYTAGELRDITTRSGLEFSRAGVEFLDDQYEGLLRVLKQTPSGGARGKYIRPTKDFVTLKSNYLADFAHFQDAELRRLIFIESLKDGRSVSQAVELAKRSMLDYTVLSKTEKDWLSRYILFYAFMRTQGTEVINTFYRGVQGNVPFENLSARILRTQDLINQSTSKDFVEYNDLQRGRLFNLWVGTTDDTDIYLSGPPNPTVQMFEMLGLAGLYTLQGLSSFTADASDRIYQEESLFWNLQQTGASLVKTFLSSQPLLDNAIKYFRAKLPDRTFNPEFLSMAQEQGLLDEVIQRYDLIPREKTAGRPLLTDEKYSGRYYNFRKGSDGMKGYRQYILDRTVGMYLLNLNMVGLNDAAVAMNTRAIQDWYKGKMLAETDENKRKYLKRASPQIPMPVASNTLLGLFMSGLITPTQSKDKKRIADQAYRNVIRTQNVE